MTGLSQVESFNVSQDMLERQIKLHNPLAIKPKLSITLNCIHAWYQHLCVSLQFPITLKNCVSFISRGDTINHIAAL